MRWTCTARRYPQKRPETRPTARHLAPSRVDTLSAPGPEAGPPRAAAQTRLLLLALAENPEEKWAKASKRRRKGGKSDAAFQPLALGFAWCASRGRELHAHHRRRS